MRQFAGMVGVLSIISGAVLLIFPEGGRRFIQTRSEFARLSTGALRMLGGWELLTGALLVSLATGAAAQLRTAEVVPPELRRAA